MKCCSLSPKNSRESYNSNKNKGMFFSLSFELEDEIMITSLRQLRRSQLKKDLRCVEDKPQGKL